MTFLRGRVAARLGVALLATLLVLPVAPAPVLGQQEPVIAEQPVQRAPFGYRKWLFALVGAVAVGVPAMLVEDELEGLRRGPCSTPECMAAVGAGLGGALGFLIGHDRDRAAARRALGAREIALRSQAIDIEFTPTLMALHAGGATVVGPQGVAIVRPDGTVTGRPQELRGVTDIAVLPTLDALLATSTAGLFAHPLSGGEGRLILRETAAMLAAVGSDQLVLGSSSLLRRLRLSGAGAQLTAQVEIEEATIASIADVEYSPFTGVLWVISGNQLLALSPQQLQVVGRVTLPVEGRTVSISGGRAVVAAGTDGVVLVDVASPEQPRLLGHVTGIPFAFRGVVHGDRVYIAAGRNGLLVLDIRDPARPTVVGTMRNLGPIQEVALSGTGEVYALSREGRRIHIVQPTAPAGAQN